MTTSPATASSTGGGGGGSGSRWCPTPEQVMMLEGMYRGGLKTPTATQIQQITARLSVYGKIQGKNVFYWFQNHKARDRQKLRKKLMALYQQHRLFPAHLDHQYPFLPLHQVSGLEDSISKSKQKMNNWKLDLPFDQTSSKLICDCPLMSMMMVDPNHGTTPYCTRVPPKTLQLFPVNATDLQEPDQSTSTQP